MMAPDRPSRRPWLVLAAVALTGLLLASALFAAFAWHRAWNGGSEGGWTSDWRGRLASALAGRDSEAGLLRVLHRWMDQQVPAGAAIFLGDSITEGLVSSNVAAASVNFGISGLTTGQLLENLPEYRSLERAGVIFLMIGINDLVRGDHEALPARLAQLQQALPAGVPLIWSGIMSAYSRLLPMSVIEASNQGIRRLCQARPGCHYLDTYRLLSGDGAARFPDGIHLDNLAYERWTLAMREVWQQVQQGRLR